MTTKVKINTVSQMNTPQGGDVIVCEGILIIVPTRLGNNYLNLEVEGWCNPYIYSPTESINYNDYVLVRRTESHFTIERITAIFDDAYNSLTTEWSSETEQAIYLPKKYVVGKILALPDEFSSKHLSNIYNKKLVNGSKVLVQCMGVMDALDGNSSDDKFIAHNGSGLVTLHKYNDLQERAEAYADKIIKDTTYSDARIHLIEAYKTGHHEKDLHN
jgi:hypothetical protein